MVVLKDVVYFYLQRSVFFKQKLPVEKGDSKCHSTQSGNTTIPRGLTQESGLTGSETIELTPPHLLPLSPGNAA